MKPSSLRVRLLMAAALAFFVALALGWLGLNFVFERHIERRESNALIHAADLLVADLGVSPRGMPVAETQPGDQRFGELASGLYWQLSTPAGVVASPSLWDQTLPIPSASRPDRWSTRHVVGPFQNELIVVDRLIRPDKGGPAVLVQIAENEAELEMAGSEFRLETAGFLLCLWLALLVGAYVQVELGLRPLHHLRQRLLRLQKSPRARLDTAFPDEILPLTRAINDLAGSREADLSRARRRAGDLAHSLKTPLSVLTAQSRRIRAKGLEDEATGMDRAIAAMSATIETELARAQAAAARGARDAGNARLLSVAEGIVAVIERTEAGEATVFDIRVPDDMTVPMAREDLAEVLGALIENAVRHARTMVRIRGTRDDAWVTVVVEDDGPGIADTNAATAMLRGGRLDEAGTGHGLGLGIVRDYAEATEATVALGKSRLGGLAASLRWQRPSRDEGDGG